MGAWGLGLLLLLALLALLLPRALGCAGACVGRRWCLAIAVALLTLVALSQAAAAALSVVSVVLHDASCGQQLELSAMNHGWQEQVCVRALSLSYCSRA